MQVSPEARRLAFVARVSKSSNHYHITVPKIIGEKLYGRKVQVVIEIIE